MHFCSSLARFSLGYRAWHACSKAGMSGHRVIDTPDALSRLCDSEHKLARREMRRVKVGTAAPKAALSTIPWWNDRSLYVRYRTEGKRGDRHNRPLSCGCDRAYLYLAKASRSTSCRCG